MAEHAAESTESNLTNERADGQDNRQPEAFTPIFGAKTRTVIYIAGVIASIVGLAFLTFGDASVGGFISTVAGFVASSFGVAYSPLRRN